MKLTDKQKKVIDIIQWVIIILLLAVCVIDGIFGKKSDNFITDTEFKKEQAYVKIYESQNIEALKKKNKELYDSIKKLKDVESALEIKYVYRYKTDTIREKEFIYNNVDSVYHYASNNDTVSCEIDVKASNLEWIQNRFVINDKFMIINREQNGMNQTFVNHSPNVEVESVDAWHRIEDKQKWYKNFHIGVQAGFGYGIFTHKPDIFVGVGVSYNIK